MFALRSGVKVFIGTEAGIEMSPVVAAAIDYAYHHGMVVVGLP